MVERLVVGALTHEPNEMRPNELATGDVDDELFVATAGNQPSCAEENVPADLPVLGLPDGYSWQKSPVEVKLSKKALLSAMEEIHGVVLRHVDSQGGELYYAVYEPSTKAFRVPAGYVTSRGFASHVKVNGAYRWLLVGVAATSKPRALSTTKQKVKSSQQTSPKWRGREYDPVHEEMAHIGNVRLGSLVRDAVNGTLDYVAEFNGKIALIERENGDLDDFTLSAQPSKLLRVVGYSSQYANEVTARG
ncbi:MAG: hypothetical protein KF743_12280 [Fimbriimonadaceae bacterium]|nr:hypothetical protein [Fimbriimonadaceae bacterium]